MLFLLYIFFILKFKFKLEKNINSDKFEIFKLRLIIQENKKVFFTLYLIYSKY